ncbi:50S ribosomal protein L11 methyltransferase [Planktotalea sp.]|uniref:50S ribosomal protein L11 methyltransferase n=1 Tax=Planktotalea sp. TaxID=2029877 RepID=UPI003D6A131F
MSKDDTDLAWLKLGQIETPVDTFLEAAMSQENAPERLADMSLKLGEKLGENDAAAIALLARSQAPQDPWIAALTSRLLAMQSPNWHWTIARDERRNAVYDRALRNCITPQSTVLEVGTGSGILAMMAARAGARHVYTVEFMPAIAAAARENIRRNGYAEKITVICDDFNNVSVGDQLPEHCNVFLQEVLADDLLGEFVLSLTEHARSKLLTKDAVHLPDSIWAMAQVGHADQPEGTKALGTQAGFDLSALDLLRRPNFSKNGPYVGFAPRTDPVEILRFDLTDPGANPPKDAVHKVSVTQNGTANAIVQWLGFSFPDGTEYSNPPNTWSSWALRIWPFDERKVAKGDEFDLRCRYDGNHVVPIAGG